MRCLPVWKRSGPMLSAGCAHVEPSWAHLGPMLGYVGLILGACRAYVGPMLPYVRPMLAHGEPSWDVCSGPYVETIVRCQFFRPGPPPGAQNYVKIDVFYHRQDEILVAEGPETP